MSVMPGVRDYCYSFGFTEWQKNKLPVKLLWTSSLTDWAIKEAMDYLHDEKEEEFINLLREAEARAIAYQGKTRIHNQLAIVEKCQKEEKQEKGRYCTIYQNYKMR